MVDTDLQIARRDAVIMREGFKDVPVSRMTPDAPIFVAGHRGMVGSALVRALRAAGFENLLLRERAELDLTCQAAVDQFFAAARPRYVFLAAARVGGILANDRNPRNFCGQSHDPEQRHRCRLPQRSRQAVVPRIELRLSEARPPAHHGRQSADRSAGADERVVRDRQIAESRCA